MNADKNKIHFLICVHLCLSVVLFSSASCKSPSKANIELRKQNQSLRDEIEGLKRRQTADTASITALQQPGGTVDQLPQSKLDQLFTVAGIKLDKLTGGFDSDPSTPGDEAIRVQVTPIDLTGEQIKAAGSIKIEAFERAGSAEPRKFGEWNFDAAQTRAAWLGQAFQYGYLLTCPLNEKPATDDVTLKMLFKDALTGRELAQEKSFKIRRK